MNIGNLMLGLNIATIGGLITVGLLIVLIVGDKKKKDSRRIFGWIAAFGSLLFILPVTGIWGVGTLDQPLGGTTISIPPPPSGGDLGPPVLCVVEDTTVTL